MEDDDAVAVCIECKTQMPDALAYKDKFLQNGVESVCKSCGGKVVVAMKSRLKQTLEQIDRQRGL